MRLVVADTGPILHFHQARALHLFGYFHEVAVSPTVLAELGKHAPELWSDGFPSWLCLASLSVPAAVRAKKWVDGKLLDPGEAESLAIAEELAPDLFLTDDTAARVMAESLGIVARGSLGVILYCAAIGVIGETEARDDLHALTTQTTLWLSATVKQRAKSALSEIFA